MLTPSQLRVCQELQHDMSLTRPMNRLLQGDVGSGKTVIAALGSFIAYKNGFQSAIMAPTEILAQQHYNTLTSLLSPFGIKVGLVTSSSKYDASGSKGKNQKRKKYLIQNTRHMILT